MRAWAPTARSCRSTSRTARAGATTSCAKGSRRCTAPRAAAGAAPYQVQAAIAAAHATAASGAATPWRAIAGLYAELEALLPSPVVRVNRAVAEGRASGARAGLALLEPLALDARSHARLDAYQPYHAARADLLREAGRAAEARDGLSPRDRAVPRRARAALPRAPARRALGASTLSSIPRSRTATGTMRGQRAHPPRKPCRARESVGSRVRHHIPPTTTAYPDSRGRDLVGSERLRRRLGPGRCATPTRSATPSMA